MKEYKVYVLKDKFGEIVYIGMTTTSLKSRLSCHLTQKKSKFCGKDLTIHLTDTYNTQEEALDREATIKFLLGFRNEILTDYEYYGKIIGKINVENKIGFLDPKNKQKVLEGRKKAVEKTSKPVLVYTTSGQFIGEYASQHECSDQINIAQSLISRCISGELKSTRGYVIKQKLTI